MKFLLVGIFFLIGSCKYTYSPYSVEIPRFRVNETAMKRIQIGEPDAPATYKIAFISDTHNYYDDLDRLVKKINSRGPYSFVIVAGDITNEGMRDEFLKTKDILNGLNFPFLVVVGNHDLLSNGKDVYSNLFGAKDFTFSYRDVTFVLLNNNNWESGGVVPDLRFLENSLASATTPNRVVVNHVSPDDPDRFTKSEIDRYKTLITTYGVNYIFNGHNHSPAEDTFAGAIKITIGAPTKKFYYELISGPGGPTHQKVSF